MANTVFKLRRSSVPGKVPNTDILSIGELALNLTDRKLYSSDGISVFETGSNLTSLSVFSDIKVGNSTVNTSINSSSLSVKSIIANGSVGTANQVLTSNGTGLYWSTSTGGGGTQLIKQQYIGDGTTTTFSVTGGYISNNLQVYLNGILLRNGVDANVQSGSTFDIIPAPANNDLIDIYGISTLYANGVSSIVTEQFTANGTANSFTISNGYLPNQILVFLNGVKQSNSDVIISSGNTVDFIITPANGYIVDVYGYQNAISYYSNNLIVGNVNISTSTISVGNSSVNTQIVAGNVFLNGSRLVVGNTATNVTVNSTAILIGTTTINSTFYTGTANNADYIKANNGIISNSSGIFVAEGTGLVVNATGVHVNSSYINTIDSNSAIFLSGNTVSTNSTALLVGNSSVNTVITSTGLVVNSIPVVLSYSINVQTTGTGSQVIDSFLKSEIRGAEYIFTLTDNSSNGYQITKALVLQDSGNSYITEYGVLYSNTVLGVFSTSVNSTHSIVSVTPSVSDMQVKGTKSLIVV